MTRAAYVILLEWKHLAFKPPAWGILAAYGLAAGVICGSPALRWGYFDGMFPCLFILEFQVMPFFLAGNLIFTLSPVYAGDREQNTALIPDTCRLGYRGRSLCRFAASVLYSVILCVMMFSVNLLLCLITGNIPNWEEIFTCDSPLLSGTFREICIISFFSLLAGGVVTACFCLFFSRISKSPLAAGGAMMVFSVIEFLPNRFGWRFTWFREFNIWQLLRGCMVFSMELFHFTPIGNFLCLVLAFVPLTAGMLAVIVLYHPE